MSRFKKTAERSEHNELVREYVLDLGNGHVVSRVDRISRLGAGRKGRAAEVSIHRELSCSCGGHLAFGGLTVAEDLANLRHFDSKDERATYETDQAEKKARVLEKLGLSTPQDHERMALAAEARIEGAATQDERERWQRDAHHHWGLA